MGSEKAKPARRGNGGRPTREDATARDERVVEVATRLFMERGFEATSLDAVAEAAEVGKPTLYARYSDKRGLFEAVVRHRIRGSLVPLAALVEAHGKEPGPVDVGFVMHALSRNLVAHATSPETAALTRCLAAQAMQFPELARLAYEEGWLAAVRAVADLLEKFRTMGRITVRDSEIAAELFLNLVLDRGTRQALYGITVDSEAQERRREAAVAMFLAGVGVSEGLRDTPDQPA